MIYLSGGMGIPESTPQTIGLMLSPAKGNLPDGRWWAADNGCFAQPQTFDLDLYLTWLRSRAPHLDTCLFATAPDVVGDARATWAQSAPALPLIRDIGYPAALVAQDGIEALPVDWDAFDVLFIGGTDAWKLSERAYRVIHEAKQRRKWVHAGRVNSGRRLRTMAMAGCDSADGTFLKFAPTINLPRMLRWMESLRRQPHMQLWEVAS